MLHWNALASGLASILASSPGALEVVDHDDVEAVWVAELGKPAPAFALADTDGKPWKLAELGGKTVVLEWFNPECPVVQAAHAADGALAKLGNEASAREDTVWVAINSGAPGTKGQGADKNAKARAGWALEYPVLLDESGAVGAAYRAQTTPHMVVIAADGAVVYEGHHAKVGAALADVWAGRAVAEPRTKPEGCHVAYTAKAEIGLLAPDFELVDARTGKPVKLSDHRGEYVVLEWFNPDCPIVKNVHGSGGTLADAASRWNAKGVRWIAVNSGAPGKQGAGAERNQTAAAAWKLEHPVLLDESGKVGRAYGATNTPHMFVLDPRGVLAYAGACDDQKGNSYVDAALDSLRAGKPVAEPRTKAYGCGVKYAD